MARWLFFVFGCISLVGCGSGSKPGPQASNPPATIPRPPPVVTPAAFQTPPATPPAPPVAKKPAPAKKPAAKRPAAPPAVARNEDSPTEKPLTAAAYLNLTPAQVDEIIVRNLQGQLPADDDAQFKSELEAAKAAQRDHPKFKKYYDFLKDNPQKLEANGPKLGKVIWDALEADATIATTPAQQRAALDSVRVLALLGTDWQLAVAALNKEKELPTNPMPIAAQLKQRTMIVRRVIELAHEPTAAPELKVTARKMADELLRDKVIHNDANYTLYVYEFIDKYYDSTAERVQTVCADANLMLCAFELNAFGPGFQSFEHLSSTYPRITDVKDWGLLRTKMQIAMRRASMAHDARKAQEKLKADPLDRNANIHCAYHLAVNRGKWQESLDYFGRASDFKNLVEGTRGAKNGTQRVEYAKAWMRIGRRDNRANVNHEVARQLFRLALQDKKIIAVARGEARACLAMLQTSVLTVSELKPADIDVKVPARHDDYFPPDEPREFNFPISGRLYVDFKGQRCMVLRNGEPILWTTGGNMTEVELNEGDLLLLRMRSDLPDRGSRVAFLEASGTWACYPKRSDVVLITDRTFDEITPEFVAAATTRPEPGVAAEDHVAAWVSHKLPQDDGEWFTGPADKEFFLAIVIRKEAFKKVK